MWFRWIAFLMFGFVLLLTQFQVSHVFAESMPPKGCWRPVLPGPGKPSFEIRNIRYSKDLNGNFIVSACLVTDENIAHKQVTIGFSVFDIDGNFLSASRNVNDNIPPNDQPGGPKFMWTLVQNIPVFERDFKRILSATYAVISISCKADETGCGPDLTRTVSYILPVESKGNSDSGKRKTK